MSEMPVSVVVEPAVTGTAVSVDTGGSSGTVVVSPVGLPGRDGDISGALLEHINNPNPHPIYDDGPSFKTIYENAKV